ncbi:MULTISPECIES: hypothetical protein [Streptomyces]|uniref:Uncharacterized protein n=1 Tax=Streptomyces fuscus TaxID=3048495 RepID=A0ABT7IUA8_9ACTN|nr:MULTISPECIES: hypothetical protein [Streptomyces]MCM1976657.1 hypothetical protein [Streptomyces sp. G1]MDL2076177.1 hypothetical protein [Streptomyces fuscus]SBT92082.1 hypothetical protein GA0115233_103951 [Streptomyces sp. DI166]
MTARPLDQKTLTIRETGWTKARQQRGKAIRTCVPAVSPPASRTSTSAGSEDNIVRGED